MQARRKWIIAGAFLLLLIACIWPLDEILGFTGWSESNPALQQIVASLDRIDGQALSSVSLNALSDGDSLVIAAPYCLTAPWLLEHTSVSALNRTRMLDRCAASEGGPHLFLIRRRSVIGYAELDWHYTNQPAKFVTDRTGSLRVNIIDREWRPRELTLCNP